MAYCAPDVRDKLLKTQITSQTLKTDPLLASAQIYHHGWLVMEDAGSLL